MTLLESWSGADESVARAASQRESLAPGTALDDFEIVGTLGNGGFGTVYLARDRSLEREVAIKEYLPAQLAYRAQGLQVAVRSAEFAATYAAGLRSFVNEARILARFNHPAVVKVHRFWEAHGTAYMVMPWVRGPTLREMRRAMRTPPTEAWLRGVLDPLLDALAQLHAQGIYHRDIAPDNVLLPSEREPVLLDFGAARRVIGDRTQTITAVLKPSFAPIEQYAEASSLRQGPWTDLYALGGVVVYMLTSMPPPPSTVRSLQDEMPLLTEAPPPGVSASFLAAIQWALAVRPQDRPQSVQEFCNALNGTLCPPPLPARSPPVVVGMDIEIDARAPWDEPAVAASGAAPGLPPPRRAPADAAAEAVAFARPASALWDPTIQLSGGAPAPAPLPVPIRAAPPRGVVVATFGGFALLCGAALALLDREPAEPRAQTWRALAQHAAELPGGPVLVAPRAVAPPAAPVVAEVQTELDTEPPLRTVLVTPPARVLEPEAAPSLRGAVQLDTPAPRAANKRQSIGQVKKRLPAAAKPAKVARIGPREACGDRNFFSRPICINWKCEQPQFSKHPQCIELRRQREEWIARRMDQR